MGIPVFTQAQIDRLIKVLRDYEAGNLTNQPISPAAKTNQFQLNLCKIDSAADGGGKYNLKIIQPTPGDDGDINDSDDLTSDDLGTEYDEPDSQKYLGIYPPEVGSSGHALKNGDYYVCLTRRQQSDDSNNTMVCIIIGGKSDAVVWAVPTTGTGYNNGVYGGIRHDVDNTLDSDEITPNNIFKTSGTDPDCVIVNLNPIDAGGHMLLETYTLPLPCFPMGTTNDGIPLFGTYGFAFESCSNAAPDDDPDYQDAPDDGGD